MRQPRTLAWEKAAASPNAKAAALLRQNALHGRAPLGRSPIGRRQLRHPRTTILPDEVEIAPTQLDDDTRQVEAARSGGESSGERREAQAWLRQIPLLRDVEEAVVDAMASAGRMRTLRGGTVLYHEGDSNVPVSFIVSGAVKIIYSSPDGRGFTAAVLGPPSSLGETELLAGAPALGSAKSIGEVQLVEIPRQVMAELLARSPALSRNAVVGQAQRLVQVARDQRSLAFDGVETRVARELLRYAGMFGQKVRDGIKLRLEISQERLAEDLAVNPRSVRRALTDWRDKGWLHKRGGYYVITDASSLQELAR